MSIDVPQHDKQNDEPEGFNHYLEHNAYYQQEDDHGNETGQCFLELHIGTEFLSYDVCKGLEHRYLS